MPLTEVKTWVFIFIAIRLLVDGSEEFFILPTAWYYVRSFGETKTFLGVLTSAYSISAVIAGPCIGKIADRFGCIKPIIVFSYFIKFGGNLVYSLPFSAMFPLLGRILAGIGDAAAGVYYGQLALYTRQRNLAKVYLFLDGMYALGASFGPTVSSFLTFRVDILGWEINAGNSPGVILALIWFTLFLVAVWLPAEFGENKIIHERTVVPFEGDDSSGDEMADDAASGRVNGSKTRYKNATVSTVFCLYYLIFLSLYYSSTVMFYTPLLALEHFRVQFIHVKLLFLTSSMFAFALILSLYIMAEYVKERKLLVCLMLRQTVPIFLLCYCAFTWEQRATDNSYVLLFYICLGMPYFSFGIGSSLLCQITDPEETAFYQGLCYSTLHLAYVLSRIISSFFFTKTSLLFYSLGLGLSWVFGAIWFCLEYRKL